MQESLKVSGNWDQIQRYPGLRSLEWKAENPEWPNRVSHICHSVPEANFIFDMMRKQKLVVLRNWL